MLSKVEELVSGVAHGGNNDYDIVASGLRVHNPARDSLDARGVGNAGTTELLNDQTHAQILGGLLVYAPSALKGPTERDFIGIFKISTHRKATCEACDSNS